ncbi:MAG: hypothetical protein CVU30_03315 [Betaproteobacteria bacterium HGW-Betaproteobacteria-3]|jgi:hypothetical protein|nr:MAG: hypothetical protein CVU30_03315 [Betaproteobacteria bacterium HGW-Betaproteobacteria-3]
MASADGTKKSPRNLVLRGLFSVWGWGGGWVPAILIRTVDFKNFFQLRPWDLTKSLDPMSGHFRCAPALHFQTDPSAFFRFEQRLEVD